MIQDIAIHQAITKAFEQVEADASISVDKEKKALTMDIHLEVALPDFVIHTLEFFEKN